MLKWIEKFIHDWRSHKIDVLNIKNEHQLELKVCQSCEILKAQLEAQNLLIRELTRPVETVAEEKRATPQPINNHVPWRVRRGQLEAAERKRAEKLLAEREREITADNLEQELQNAEQPA